MSGNGGNERHSESEPGAVPPNGTAELWELRLYTAGQTPKSVLAFNNLKRICEEYMPGRYQIEVIDLLQNPRLAKEDQIVAIPTLVRKLPHAAFGRMDAHEQLVERQRIAFGNHELAVEDEARGRQLGDRGDDLGEIALERLPALRPQMHVRRVLEREAAESVPFGLVLPRVPLGQRGDRFRLHRRVIERDRQRHSMRCLRACAWRCAR